MPNMDAAVAVFTVVNEVFPINIIRDGRLTAKRRRFHITLCVVDKQAMQLRQALFDLCKVQVEFGLWLRESLPDIVLNAMLLLGTLIMGALIFRVVRVNVRDQTELTMLRDELTSINHTLQTMALADGLTGLANRRQFDLFLSQALKTASLTGRPVSLIMLDIDYFKRYNDAYGHVAGDNCLRHVGEALQKLNLRQSDLIARYGGEEFAIILPDTDRDAAFITAEM